MLGENRSGPSRSSFIACSTLARVTQSQATMDYPSWIATCIFGLANARRCCAGVGRAGLLVSVIYVILRWAVCRCVGGESASSAGNL